ncbi:hypothetical protein QP519_03110 [Weeksella virosa]|uniref:hypothetical protein n=1 Tax=Weeksella virosa TaxID=1014 RepID=UPI00255636E0|nr:hypothetical protein [Weeksella virosa]MDK7374526.1 hypothetical protein [Weeksella virosa]
MALSEKEIGENAQRMVERALLSEIRASGLHLSNSVAMDRKTKNKQPLTPLLKSSAHKRMNVDNTDQLFGIAVHLGKHGFVHNFGVNTTRKTHTATSKKGRLYTRNSHRFHLSSNKMINTAISKSGAVNYIAEKVTEARGEEVVSKIMGVFR